MADQRMARWLQANPYCVECAKEGKRQLASYVDHITPHKRDPALFWNTANWQTLCFHHHNVLLCVSKARHTDHGCTTSAPNLAVPRSPLTATARRTSLRGQTPIPSHAPPTLQGNLPPSRKSRS